MTDPNDPDWILLDERKNDKSLPAANYTPTDFIVSKPVKSLTLSKHSATLLPGEKLQLKASAENVSIESLTLQWTSTNQAIATVSEQGLIVANAIGKADIIVSALQDKSLRDTCTVTVVKERLGYRYYQFAIEETAGNSQIQLSELDFLDKDGEEITPLTLYAYTGSHYGNEEQENLFDDDVLTKYCGSFKSTVYLYIDAGEEVALSGYRLTTANDTQSHAGRNPITWSLYGSNSKSEDPDDEDWTLIDRRENDNTLGAFNYEPYDFFITPPEPEYYTLVYMVDDEEYESFTIQYGENITPLVEPEREGYTFSGWSEIPETMPAHDVVVTGSFTINSYTVTFMYGDEVLYTEEVNYGASIPLPEILDKYGLVYKWLDVPETMPARDIVIMVDETDMIESLTPSLSKGEEDVYNLNGRRLSAPQKGINIIRTSDGTILKMLIK